MILTWDPQVVESPRVLLRNATPKSWQIRPYFPPIFPNKPLRINHEKREIHEMLRSRGYLARKRWLSNSQNEDASDGSTQQQIQLITYICT